MFPFDAQLRLSRSSMGMLLAALFGGCSVNPPQPVVEISTSSPAADADLYGELHDVIVQHYGRYENDVLQGLAQRIAEQLAVRSQIDQAVFRVTILDTPEFNAFSHSGGYIYIERGLLAYLNSEAELAAVIAHELAHLILDHDGLVAAPGRPDNAQVAADRFALAVINNPDVRQQLLSRTARFSRGYGRPLEFATLGVSAQMMARAGYDPQELLQTLKALRVYEEGAKKIASEKNTISSVYHGVTTLDPAADPRIGEAILAAAKSKTDALYYVPSNNLLPQLEGLQFGEPAWYRAGPKNKISHKNMGITLAQPEEWSSLALVDGIVFYPPDQQAFLATFGMEADLEVPLRQFMENYFELDKLSGGQEITFPTASMLVGEARLKTIFGERKAVIGAGYVGERAVVFAAAAEDEAFWAQKHNVLALLLDSIRPWSEADEKRMNVLKLKTVAAKQGATFAKLLDKQTKAVISIDELRLLNRLYPNGEPAPDQQVKILSR